MSLGPSPAPGRVFATTRWSVVLRAGGTSPEAAQAALADAAAQLTLTLPALKSLLHRFRQRYRELLLDEVGQTVGTRSDVAEELRGLLQALRAA